jgi:hypothetical protein
MNQILLYVDPDKEDDYFQIVAWAADLVEAATADIEGSATSRPLLIGVVAPVECCLRIGAVMLGRADARTVEQGLRSPSSVRLFPFAPGHWDENAPPNVALDCLRELANAGAVEGLDVEDGSGDAYDRPRLMSLSKALEVAFDRNAWEAVLVLGGVAGTEELPLLGPAKGQGPEIIRPRRDVRERVNSLLGFADTSGDELTDIRRRVATDAVRFVDMFERLQIES